MEALESLSKWLPSTISFKSEGPGSPAPSSSVYMMLIAKSGVVLLNAGDHEDRSGLPVERRSSSIPR